MRWEAHPRAYDPREETTVHHTDTTTATCPGNHSEDTPGNPVWCHDHASRIHSALTGLPAAYRALASTKALDTGRKEILRAPSPEPQSPSRRMDYADVILRDLCRWEDDLRQKLGHPAAKHEASHTTRAIYAAVRYLTHHHLAALNAPGARDYGQEILTLARTADRLLGAGDTALKPARERLEGLCERCSARTLWRVNGRDVVACTTCRHEVSHEHYQRTAAWLLHAYGQPIAA